MPGENNEIKTKYFPIDKELYFLSSNKKWKGK